MSHTIVKIDSDDPISSYLAYYNSRNANLELYKNLKNYHCGYQFGYENALFISGALGFSITLTTTISAVGIVEWTKISPGTATLIGIIACPILSLMGLHLGIKLSQYPEVQNACGIACGRFFAAKSEISHLLI